MTALGMVLAAASGLTVFIGLLVARVRVACLTVGFLMGFAAELIAGATLAWGGVGLDW